MDGRGVPAPLSAIVMRALSLDPVKRPTAAALADELSALTRTLSAEELSRVYGKPPAQQDEVITITDDHTVAPTSGVRPGGEATERRDRKRS